MHALLSRDDHAVVVTPNDQSLETVALAGCPVTHAAYDIMILTDPVHSVV